MCAVVAEVKLSCGSHVAQRPLKPPSALVAFSAAAWSGEKALVCQYAQIIQ